MSPAGTAVALALEALIASLVTPGAIHPGLARQVSDHAARALRPTLHRRVPADGSPLAAFTGVGAEPAGSAAAHL
jgi:hypothetical protein